MLVSLSMVVVVPIGLALLHMHGLRRVRRCWTVLGTVIVAVGHFAGRVTELLSAVVLTVGLTATSWVAGRHVRARLGDRAARSLVLVASLATPATSALAVWCVLGRATGLPDLSIAETAATHGVVNAVGVGLCGLLAWWRAGMVRL